MTYYNIYKYFGTKIYKIKSLLQVNLKSSTAI